MKIRRILIGLLFLTLILAAPVQADLTPAHWIPASIP